MYPRYLPFTSMLMRFSSLFHPSLQILKRTQNTPETLKVLAVKGLAEILLSTGEEGLSMLPDCLPHLQELLEDGSSEVTKATRKLILDVEEILGEVGFS